MGRDYLLKGFFAAGMALAITGAVMLYSECRKIERIMNTYDSPERVHALLLAQNLREVRYIQGMIFDNEELHVAETRTRKSLDSLCTSTGLSAEQVRRDEIETKDTLEHKWTGVYYMTGSLVLMIPLPAAAHLKKKKQQTIPA
ncbi:MAG: hypothetical protein V1743_05610 [Nanoarchaeota archaeon]